MPATKQRRGGREESMEEDSMEMETEGQDPVEMLKEDHRKVEELFEQFEHADTRTRQRIADSAFAELETHTKLEENLIYPAIREGTGDDEMMDKAHEEHHVVALLMKELRKMQPKHEGYAAKFKVLGEIVRHHVEEEENEMFPQAQKADIDWEELGREAAGLRAKLMRKHGQGKQGSRRPSKDGAQRRRKAA